MSGRLIVCEIATSSVLEACGTFEIWDCSEEFMLLITCGEILSGASLDAATTSFSNDSRVFIAGLGDGEKVSNN